MTRSFFSDPAGQQAHDPCQIIFQTLQVTRPDPSTDHVEMPFCILPPHKVRFSPRVHISGINKGKFEIHRQASPIGIPTQELQVVADTVVGGIGVELPAVPGIIAVRQASLHKPVAVQQLRH